MILCKIKDNFFEINENKLKVWSGWLLIISVQEWCLWDAWMFVAGSWISFAGTRCPVYFTCASRWPCL